MNDDAKLYLSKRLTSMLLGENPRVVMPNEGSVASIQRQADRRQHERRAPQPGVTTRHDDPKGYTPKRVRWAPERLKGKR